MGLESVLDVKSIFFVKENWICDMTRHHAERSINMFDKKSSFGL